MMAHNLCYTTLLQGGKGSVDKYRCAVILQFMLEIQKKLGCVLGFFSLPLVHLNFVPFVAELLPNKQVNINLT